MAIKMEQIGNQYKLTRRDGSEIILEWSELNVIEEYIRQRAWRANLEDQIDEESDSIDFSVLPRDEFVNQCIEEMQSLYECCDICEPDYADIVFGVAEYNDMWKE